MAFVPKTANYHPEVNSGFRCAQTANCGLFSFSLNQNKDGVEHDFDVQ